MSSTPELKNVPDRWPLCPKFGERIPGTPFVPMKTPLGEKFNKVLYEEHHFTPRQFIEAQRARGRNVVAVFSFANTTMRYNVDEFGGAEVFSIKCNKEAPEDRHYNEFREKLASLRERLSGPDDVVAIHCTHGFNRTGFIIVRYLVQECGMRLEEAITTFREYRSPGIYKEDYLRKLFDLFHEPMTIHSPGKPNELWNFPPGESLNHYCVEQKVPKDTEGTPLVGTIVTSSIDNEKINNMLKRIPGSRPKFFPGSQPVTLEIDTIHQLEEDKTYRATYKSDGIRYFLIACEERAFLVNRKLKKREVKSVLVDRKGQRLKYTILDGELVAEKDDNGNVYHNFLIFDIINFEGVYLIDNNWDTRMDYVSKGICKFREMWMKEKPEMFKDEDFKISNKKQWKLNRLHKLELYIQNKVRHETDGIIFTPLSMLYILGRCDQILKWKPIELNSTDFLAIQYNDLLYLTIRNDFDRKQPVIPISILDIKDSEYKKELNNAFIECIFDKDTQAWKPLRRRTDKKFPNGYNTFASVYRSVRDDITLESLKQNFGCDNSDDPDDPDL